MGVEEEGGGNGVGGVGGMEGSDKGGNCVCSGGWKGMEGRGTVGVEEEEGGGEGKAGSACRFDLI